MACFDTCIFADSVFCDFCEFEETKKDYVKPRVIINPFIIINDDLPF